jgi:hypothetical protein
LFGGTGGVEARHLIFADGAPAGAVHFVEWELPAAVPLAGFNLRALDDVGIFQRAVQHVRLLADTGTGFEVFFEADVETPYNGTPEQDVLLISTAITPIVAQRFRAEFTQAFTCTFCGPRLVELDGYPAGTCADPNYTGSTSASDALIALNAAVGIGSCPRCACDLDNGGTVTASDALAILKTAVGLAATLACPECFDN